MDTICQLICETGSLGVNDSHIYRQMIGHSLRVIECHSTLDHRISIRTAIAI